MYVFGNGESRTSVNISNLEGIKVGCNAIYRDYTMDHLICVDRRMVRTISVGKRAICCTTSCKAV